jgi:hypothetical protein
MWEIRAAKCRAVTRILRALMGVVNVSLKRAAPGAKPFAKGLLDNRSASTEDTLAAVVR